MVGDKPKTVKSFTEDQQRDLVVEHITATPIDLKPLRKFAQKHGIVERSYRKIRRRQTCKMLYDLIRAGVITGLTVKDKRVNKNDKNIDAKNSIREAKVLEFDRWYKRIPCGRRAQLTVTVVINAEACLASNDDLFRLLDILGQCEFITRVAKVDPNDDEGSIEFGEWYEEISKLRLASSHLLYMSKGLERKPIEIEGDE